MSNAIKIIAAIAIVGGGIYLYTQFGMKKTNGNSDDGSKDKPKGDIDVPPSPASPPSGSSTSEPSATNSTTGNVVVNTPGSSVTVSPGGAATYAPEVPVKPLTTGEVVYAANGIKYAALILWDATISKGIPYSYGFNIPKGNKIGTITKISGDKAVVKIVDSPTYRELKIKLLQPQLTSALPPRTISEVSPANQTTIVKLTDLKR